MRYYDVTRAAQKLGITYQSVVYRCGMNWYPSKMIEGRLYVGLNLGEN